MAYLEAAAVPAFERLARELEAHGAPVRLQRCAMRAARDEVRHTKLAGALARREGATVRLPRVKAGRVRSLEAIARENAVEGCVLETFAAALALAQSLAATDASVRGVMRRVAADELRHAELSWEVATWLEGQLDAPARRRVVRARERAAANVIERASRPVHRELTGRLGLPVAGRARAIARALARELWSDA